MLKNYIKEDNGVIRQVRIKEKIDYNKFYIENSYEKYGELPNYISYLRYGYLVAAINKTPDSILDFGYGNGAFLNICQNEIKKCYGYDITNIELSINFEKIHKFKDIFLKHFNVVSFFDSLEHVRDINFLYKLDCEYIIISVPECHYFSDKWFKEWKHRRENEHLWHFSRKALSKYMYEQGYETIVISNIEDVIRKSEYNYSNILTAVFKNINK